jgi:hypothetical protein
MENISRNLWKHYEDWKTCKRCKTKDFEDFRASMKNIGKNKRIG